MTGDFPVSNAGIAGAFDLIARAVQQFDATDTIAHRLSVVLDELCSNMIRHDDTLSEATNFALDMAIEGGTVHMAVSDPGLPFNPLVFRHAETPEIGGHGISLVKGLSSAVAYSREDDRNVLRVSVEIEE